jgi:hypothetical protein
MHSEYRHFASQTRRTWDDFHFFCLERGLVECATSDQMEDKEQDDLVIGLDDWINEVVLMHSIIMSNYFMVVVWLAMNMKSYVRY